MGEYGKQSSLIIGGCLDDMEGQIDSYLRELKDQFNIEEKTFSSSFINPPKATLFCFLVYNMH